MPPDKEFSTEASPENSPRIIAPDSHWSTNFDQAQKQLSSYEAYPPVGPVDTKKELMASTENSKGRFSWKSHEIWLVSLTILVVAVAVLGVAMKLTTKHSILAGKSSTPANLAIQKQTAPKPSTATGSSNKSILAPTGTPAQKEPLASSPSSAGTPKSASSSYTIANYSPINEYGTNFYYAGASESIAGAKGASVNFTQADPSVPVIPNKEDHSLIELATTVKSGYNYIEVGWTVDPMQFGDSNAHLFISRWIGTTDQCYVSSINTCGFTQVSGTTPGEAISSSGIGNFKINLVDSNWYVYYNNNEIGYFPESLWGSNADLITTVQVFGEVEIQSNTTTCVQMGNGLSGTSPSSARVSDYSLISSSDKSAFTSFYQTPSNNYYLGLPAATNFNIGGPGIC